MATILVVDDQEAVCSLLRVMLEGDGHQVLEASNGRLGLERYGERCPDLVITDLVMPEMTGLEMMWELNRRFLNVKIIAISGSLASGDAQKMAKRLGACQTFQKPLNMEEVLSAVRYELTH